MQRQVLTFPCPHELLFATTVSACNPNPQVYCSPWLMREIGTQAMLFSHISSYAVADVLEFYRQ